jgi:acyl-CoA synthetase (AMP-forming)/AMP-acid ligase II
VTDSRAAPETLFGQLAARHAGAGAARVALITPRGTLSYGQCVEYASAIASHLLAAGITSGDRVLLVFPNGPEHVLSVLAVSQIGAIAVPCAPDTAAERLVYIAEHTRAAYALRAVNAPALVTASTPIALAWDPPRLDVGAPAVGRDAANVADAPALILFSSGSTGRPKGVVLRNRPLLWTTRTLVATYAIGADHRELLICPLSHSDGWDRVSATLYAGGAVVIPEGLLSVSGMLEDCVTFGVTGFFTPPPLIRLMLSSHPDRARRALASCRSLEIGSAPIAAEELRAFQDLVPASQLFVHYGLTESSRAVILDTRAAPDKLATVGRPCGVDIAIRDARGNVVAPGVTGQIYLQGLQTVDSYWGQPALTEERFVDGWFATGDLGSIDADGFVTFAGRRDEMITSAGYHYFPAEVETDLGPIEGVVEYLVAGVPDPRGVLEQVPWAFVVPADPGTWDPVGFVKAARTRLPAHMVPRKIVVVEDLPKTAAGKPNRRETVGRYGPDGSVRTVS